MAKNYFITAIRNFFKSILHVCTNVIGLGIGIAMCIMAFILNAFNSEFNNCYSDETTDQIYRLEYSKIENDKNVFYGTVNVSYTHFLEDEVPGIESVIRFFGRRATVKCDNERFGEFLSFSNKEFIETFPLQLVEGSFLEFNEPNAIYLNDELAEKFFKDQSAVGKSIEVKVKDTEGGIQGFIIKGVFKKNPMNSSFNYIEMLTNFENLYRIYQVDKYDPSIEIAAETFIKVSDRKVLTNPTIFSKLNEYTLKKDAEGKIDYRLAAFEKIYKSSYDNSIRNTFSNSEISRETLLTFDLIGLMILLIACFNYTIYAFSFAGVRLKEIGIRKVNGGAKKQILLQFMSESLVLCIISLLVGLLFAQIIIPLFQTLWGGFTYGLSDINITRIVLFLICLTIVMTFVSGFYPAIYVSKYSPAAIIARNAKLKKSGWVTYSLILIQQVITIVGLGASIIFTENIYWQENMDYGYDRDNLLTIQGLNATEKGDVFVEIVKQHPKVVSAGLSWKMLGNGTGDRKITLDGKDYYVDLMETGPNYMETNKVHLVKGRFWRNNSLSDMKSSALVNKRFLEVTKLNNPIGKQITLLNGHEVTIIGVIENYKQAGPWEESQPTVIHYPLEEEFKFLAIRGKSMKDLKEIDTYCEEQWKKLEPFMPYVSMYETGNIEGALETSSDFKDTFLFSAIVALLLSVGGMFSLVTMLVQRRTKEIAIRKTIGSGVKSILYLISKPYISISVIAGVFGSVLGIVLVNGLLDDIYDYHVKVKIIWYVLVSLLMLTVTLLTISTHTIRAANANPVNSLRNE